MHLARKTSNSPGRLLGQDGSSIPSFRAAVPALLACLALCACGGNVAKTDVSPADPAAENSQARLDGAEILATPAAHKPPPPVGNYSAPALSGDYAEYPAAHAMIDRLVKEQGFPRDYLNGVFSLMERDDWIVDFVNRPTASGPPRPGGWTRYRNKFLTETRIDKGQRFWRDYKAALDRAQQIYGVPAEYVVAIIGVETHYGVNVGKHKVANALANMAFDFPRRADFFSDELETFMVMARNQGMDPFMPVGSYAGAMGLGQFMPSSFQKYAVDFDGDGRIDIWSPTDAIGSVANYFSGHGWRAGEPVTFPAVTRGRVPEMMEVGFSSRYTPAVLADKGIVSSKSIDGHPEVSLLLLRAAGGDEYWVGLNNFYVITRYNHSTYYAMAVHQLAQALKWRGPAPAGPTGTLMSRSDGGPKSETL